LAFDDSLGFFQRDGLLAVQELVDPHHSLDLLAQHCGHVVSKIIVNLALGL